MPFRGFSGKIKHLRVSDSDHADIWGPPGDQLVTQVVVVLDTHLDLAFGFEIKGNDPNVPSRLAMLSTLRDVYIHDLTVGFGCDIEDGKHGGIIKRIDLERGV